VAKKDSAIALSQQIPVDPIDLVMPFSAANVVICADAYWVPLSLLNGFPFNTDYAEPCVKPRNRGFACAGGVR
jgi:hypothetical protein